MQRAAKCKAPARSLLRRRGLCCALRSTERGNGSQKIKTENYGAKVAGTIRPHTTNGGDSGASDARWGTVYASNGSINTSDRNEKNSILEADLGLDFINELTPVSFKFNKSNQVIKFHWNVNFSSKNY